ncbi:hypothetical protein K8Q94_00980 [Candidatus Nomurabacteria bacterium]|nr:hypothetical protein [Candidatus Nomurabacteria bacterium]
MNNFNNKQGGFLQLIVFIVVIVLIMWYFHLTVHGIIAWFVTMIQNVW